MKSDILSELLQKNDLLDDLVRREELKKAMLSLSERQRIVIRMRYGLYPYKKRYTLREIGKICKVTAERIRHLEWKALRNLYKELIRQDYSFLFNK